jgi:uncharacterized integral membrane protein
MRWLNIVVIVVLVAVMLVFAIQNLQTVTVAFLRFSLTAPLSILIVVIYLLGMATGGSLWALIRWAIDGYKRPAVS